MAYFETSIIVILRISAKKINISCFHLEALFLVVHLSPNRISVQINNTKKAFKTYHVFYFV